MKKVLFSLTAMFFAGSLSAGCIDIPYGYPGDPLSSLINPCPYGFYVGLTGMWAVPTETGLGTFTDSWQYLNSDGSITSLSKPSKNDYEFAGGFQVGYDFPCSGNNIEVEYFHLHNSKHNVFGTSDGPISFGSIFFDVSFPLALLPEFVSDSRLKYHLNQVDVTLGHRFIACSAKLQLHPFMGARFASLKHDLPFAFGEVRSRYHGAGPIGGIDCSYDFCKGFSLVGRFDGSLLMGKVKADSRLTFGEINTRFESPSQNRLVSTFGGKLGLAYNFTCFTHSSVRFEVGYQANNYIGVFDTITGQDSSDPVLQRISSLTTNNFSYSGPYINLTWHL